MIQQLHEPQFNACTIVDWTLTQTSISQVFIDNNHLTLSCVQIKMLLKNLHGFFKILCYIYSS